MTEREAVAAAGMERLAAVVPPHAHRRAARHVRAAQPGRSPDRARRSVHDRLRHLGRPHLPGRVRRRVGGRAARADPDYVDRLVAPYFAAIAEWYGAIRIGVTGGELHDIIDRHLGDPFFGIFLNPGHQLHLDEWVNSPISPGSTIELRSGMAFQVDVIPATGTEYFTTNIEDGIALADAPLRDRSPRDFPEAWARIQQRRRTSWRTSSASTSIPTSCRSRTCRPTCRRSSSPGPCDDARRMSRPPELVLRSDELEVVLLPELGGRIHRLRAFGTDLLRTPPDPAHHADDPFFWGAYVMAPWCNRAAPGPTVLAGRDGPPGRRTSPTARPSTARFRPALAGWAKTARLHVTGGGDGWPWPYEVVARVRVRADPHL